MRCLASSEEGQWIKYVLRANPNLLNPTDNGINPTDNGTNPTDKTISSSVGPAKYANREDWEEYDGVLQELPSHLQKIVDALPARVGTKKMATAILSLCEWRDLKAAEIAAYCRRNAQYLRERHISTLLEDKLLNLTDQPSSPNLRYCISKQGKEWLNRKRRAPDSPDQVKD